MNNHDCFFGSHMVSKFFSTIDMSTLFCLPNPNLYSLNKLDNDKWPQQSYTPMFSSMEKESVTVTTWRGISITMKTNRAQHLDNSFWKTKAVHISCTWSGGATRSLNLKWTGAIIYEVWRNRIRGQITGKDNKLCQLGKNTE